MIKLRFSRLFEKVSHGCPERVVGDDPHPASVGLLTVHSWPLSEISVGLLWVYSCRLVKSYIRISCSTEYVPKHDIQRRQKTVSWREGVAGCVCGPGRAVGAGRKPEPDAGRWSATLCHWWGFCMQPYVEPGRGEGMSGASCQCQIFTTPIWAEKLKNWPSAHLPRSPGFQVFRISGFHPPPTPPRSCRLSPVGMAIGTRNVLNGKLRGCVAVPWTRKKSSMQCSWSVTVGQTRKFTANQKWLLKKPHSCSGV